MAGRKILVITGSPRPEGNTNTMAKAFIMGAEAAGHEVEVFDAAKANVEGCHGDQSCFKRGCCGLKDDGVRMNELMQWADLLVLCAPVYWAGFPSQIKRVIDRFYQFSAPKGRATCTVKETFLISACANPDAAMFEGVLGTYRLVDDLLGFTSIGELLVPGLAGPDAIDEKPEILEKAVRAGYLLGK